MTTPFSAGQSPDTPDRRALDDIAELCGARRGDHHDDVVRVVRSMLTDPAVHNARRSRALAVVKRLSASLQDLIENCSDPGSEAYGAVWEGNEFVRQGGGATAAPTLDPDVLARALHDADCGCGDYDEVEDPRYIQTVRAALAAPGVDMSAATRKRPPDSATPPVLNEYPEEAWKLAEIVSDVIDGERDDYVHNDVAKALWDSGWRDSAAPGVDTAAPGLSTESEQRFEHLATLGPNWDSYDAQPPSTVALVKAREIAGGLAGSPLICPTTDGGVQLAWPPDGERFEIVVAESGAVGITVDDVEFAPISAALAARTPQPRPPLVPNISPCLFADDGEHRWGLGRDRDECAECDAPRLVAEPAPQADGPS